MKYLLMSTREDSVTLDGLGVLGPGETLEVDAQAAAAFKHTRGLSLAQVSLPEGVGVTIAIGDVPTKEEVN